MNKQDESTEYDVGSIQTEVSDDTVTVTANGEAVEMATTIDETTEEVLQTQLGQIQEDLKAAKDETLRAQAEMINMRRRAEQDVAKAHKFGQEKLVNELLPVIDNLERAVSSCNADNANLKTLREGVQMTQKMLVDGLAKFGIEAIDPMGQPFDPKLHEAMTMIPKPDVEPNTVVQVMNKGYILYGRLVRPAMVIVSKA